MPVISNSTFDPLKRYVRVRLAQGVPIVDADVNERDDIHMFELRAFLKWFVGNGVPDGNDGFRIRPSAPASATDFTIGSGITGTSDALGNVGRCLVDGLDVLIAADVNYAAQPLHQSQPGAATLAAQLNVPVAANLPATAGPYCVYLDVWERLVTSSEDAALVPLGLGIESCARMKREWVVRVAAGLLPPAAPAAHSHYALAVIQHTGGAIVEGDITDMREQRLLVPPSTLITDLFGGTAVDYRRGGGRPPISLRDAINALIRGDVPTLPEVTIAAAVAADDRIGRGAFLDAAQRPVIVWWSNRTAEFQLYAAAADPANPGAYTAAQQLTGGPGARTQAHAVALNGNRILVVFEAANGPNSDVKLKFGALASVVPAMAETNVATGGSMRLPFAVRRASVPDALLLWHDNAVPGWRFAKFTEPGGVGTVGAPAALSATNTPRVVPLHAARATSEVVYAAFIAPSSGAPAGDNVRVMRVPTAGSPTSVVNTAQDVGDELGSPAADQDPFVLVDGDDNPWVFWSSGGQSIWHSTRSAGPWNAAAEVPGTSTAVASTNAAPCAVVDPDGTIWLFWQSNRSGNQDVWFTRRLRQTASWTDPRPLTGTPNSDNTPFAVAGSDGTIALYWRRVIGVAGEVISKRLVAKV